MDSYLKRSKRPSLLKTRTRLVSLIWFTNCSKTQKMIPKKLIGPICLKNGKSFSISRKLCWIQKWLRRTALSTKILTDAQNHSIPCKEFRTTRRRQSLMKRWMISSWRRKKFWIMYQVSYKKRMVDLEICVIIWCLDRVMIWGNLQINYS